MLLPFWSGAIEPDSLERMIRHAAAGGQNDSSTISWYVQLIDACRSGEPFKGLDLAETAKQKAISCNDRRGLANIFNKEGNIYYDMGLYSQAISCYSQSLMLLKNGTDNSGIAYCYNDIGYVYHTKKLYPLAIETYRKAIDQLKSDTTYSARKAMAHTCSNIAFSFQGQKEPDSARKYFMLTLLNCKKLHDIQKLGQSYAYMAIFEMQHGEFAKALKYIRQAQELQLKDSNSYFYGYSLLYEGDILVAKGEPVHAQQLYDTALALFIKSNHPLEQVRTLLRKMKLYEQLSAYAEAEHTGLTALNISRGMSFHSETTELLHKLIKIATLQNDNTRLVEYQRQLIALNDSTNQALLANTIRQIEHTEQIQNRKFISRLEQKNSYALYLEKELSSQNRILLFVLLTFILILTIILLANINYRRKRDERTIQLETQLESEQNERQKIYNIISKELNEPLNNFYEAVKLITAEKNLFSLNDSNQIIEQSKESFKRSELLLLNLFVWTSLRSGNTDRLSSFGALSLRQLVTKAAAKAFIPYQTKELQIINDVEENVMAKGDMGKVNLILWNLLDNAMRHSPEGAYVRISAREKNNMTEICVRDKGEGMKHAPGQVFEFNSYKGQSSAGMGLQVCSLLVNLHGGEIWFETEPGAGTSFYFTLPG